MRHTRKISNSRKKTKKNVRRHTQKGGSAQDARKMMQERAQQFNALVTQWNTKLGVWDRAMQSWHNRECGPAVPTPAQLKAVRTLQSRIRRNQTRKPPPPMPPPSRPLPSRPLPSRPLPSRPLPSRPASTRPASTRPLPSRPPPIPDVLTSAQTAAQEELQSIINNPFSGQAKFAKAIAMAKAAKVPDAKIKEAQEKMDQLKGGGKSRKKRKNHKR